MDMTLEVPSIRILCTLFGPRCDHGSAMCYHLMLAFDSYRQQHAMHMSHYALSVKSDSQVVAQLGPTMSPGCLPLALYCNKDQTVWVHIVDQQVLTHSRHSIHFCVSDRVSRCQQHATLVQLCFLYVSCYCSTCVVGKLHSYHVLDEVTMCFHKCCTIHNKSYTYTKFSELKHSPCCHTISDCASDAHYVCAANLVSCMQLKSNGDIY